MRGDPAPHFREYLHAPDYSAMRQSGFGTLHNGFMMNNSGLDAFMHARREQRQCAGAFAGDKLHISVKREDVPLAFNALSGLLFSEDCPIDKWKVTDMERVEPGGRVSEGAQLTLYVKPDTADSRYTAQGLNRIRHFVERLESVMIEHNIQPGQHPDSDVRPFHWQFTSYRNEMRSEREGGEEQSLALRNEPFYRLVTE
ncbi:phosphothreonine lyase [Pseudomonas sp. LAMO17WK12:I10]|nr:phosphothreonine lyase [Pseudomonas sp. LAMO17WK12:I9]SNY39908.1 phosphothreonine lyase [Pseudomonas sp. LAMO17WK12:I10]